jgi:hypothetical protein
VGILHANQGGLSESCPLKSDGSRFSDVEAELCDRWPKTTLGGGHPARVHSDQMVLMMAKQRGWTTMRLWPKTPKSNLNLKGDYQARVHSGQMVLV